MQIRIVKNAKNLNNNLLCNNSVLRVEKQATQYEKFSLCKGYMYNIEKNKEEEILTEYKKYDLFKIVDVQNSKRFIYFLNIDDIEKESPTYTVYKYDVTSKEVIKVYSFENKLEQYLSYAKIKIFVINEDFVLIQNEYLRANLTEDYEGYFDFDLQLYCVHEDRLYNVLDENLNNNGIEQIVALEDNICAIKTGFSLIEDSRYKKLSKNEVSVESVSIVNILQLVSDMKIMKQSIIIDNIDCVYYDSTIPYIEKNGDFLIYSKVNFEKNEEEIVFYNFKSKQAIKCINTNVHSTSDLGVHYVIGGQPYIMHMTQKGASFYNILKNKVDFSFSNDNKVESVCNDFVIVSSEKKKLFGKKAKYISVYKHPLMNIVHSEKGLFKNCISGDYDEIFVLINTKGEM